MQASLLGECGMSTRTQPMTNILPHEIQQLKKNLPSTTSQVAARARNTQQGFGGRRDGMGKVEESLRQCNSGMGKSNRDSI